MNWLCWLKHKWSDWKLAMPMTGINGILQYAASEPALAVGKLKWSNYELQEN